jgi:hypothetical protein
MSQVWEHDITRVQKHELNLADFNSVAARGASNLQRYEPAIAAMEEVQSWGEDSQGRYFAFEVMQNSQQETILMGVVRNHHVSHDGTQVPALIVGMPPDQYAPDWCEYMAIEVWIDPSVSMSESLKSAAYFEESDHYLKAASSAQAVASFVEFYMQDHPGFQRIVQAPAKDVIGKIEPKAPALKR